MKIFTHLRLAVFVLMLTCSFPGCSIHQNSTTPITRVSAFPRVIERASKDKRYFVMHSGVDSFAITSVLMEKSKKNFTVHLGKIDSLHRVNADNTKLSPGKRIDLYMRDSVSYTLDEPHTIPLNKVERIELGD